MVTYDSNGEMSFGEMTVETVQADSEYILTLTVDEDFLKDENTAYPVYVDPSITIMPNFTVSEDAMIWSGAPYRYGGDLVNSYIKQGDGSSAWFYLGYLLCLQGFLHVYRSSAYRLFAITTCIRSACYNLA